MPQPSDGKTEASSYYVAFDLGSGNMVPLYLARDVAEWTTTPDGRAQIDGLIELARSRTGAEQRSAAGHEQEVPVFRPPARLGRLIGGLLLFTSLSAVALATVQFVSGTPVYPLTSPAAKTGLVNVTTPGGSLEVLHRGRPIGKTPISVSLSAGNHELVLRGNGAELRFTVPVTAGEPASISFPLPAPVSQAR